MYNFKKTWKPEKTIKYRILLKSPIDFNNCIEKNLFSDLYRKPENYEICILN